MDFLMYPYLFLLHMLTIDETLYYVTKASTLFGFIYTNKEKKH